MPESEDQKRRRCVMIYLIRMVMVDGHFSVEEKEMVAQYGARFDFTYADVQACMAHAVSDAPVPRPAAAAARLEIFRDVAKLAACDGLEPAEIAYLKQVAQELELPAAAVAPLIAEEGPA